MEEINDSSKLIAMSLELLRTVQCEDCQQASNLGNAINNLELALDKLTNKI